MIVIWSTIIEIKRSIKKGIKGWFLLLSS